MDDPIKHKFKVEAIIPDSSLQNRDTKEIFDIYESNKSEVPRQFLKLNSLFINSLKGNAPYDFDFGLDSSEV